MKKAMCIALVVTLWLCGQAFGDPIVVVNNSVAISALDLDSLQKIYLGRKTEWESGGSILPVTLEAGNVHASFLKTFIHKNTAQFSNYWRQMIFTGKGSAPLSFSSESEMVDFVTKTPGSIGYIDSATPHESVKKIPVK